MFSIRDLTDILDGGHRKNSCACRGICTSVALLGLAVAIYTFYKTTDMECRCHVRCKGKFCNCNFDKGWKTTPLKDAKDQEKIENIDEAEPL
ncbi:MAG: hypothetical protein LBH37_03015 [Oscillospiraceae bacterium]|jgi:hypothetical protein|nr:hypothetical protein [Oscillospiraceae bacterium]